MMVSFMILRLSLQLNDITTKKVGYFYTSLYIFYKFIEPPSFFTVN